MVRLMTKLSLSLSGCLLQPFSPAIADDDSQNLARTLLSPAADLFSGDGGSMGSGARFAVTFLHPGK